MVERVNDNNGGRLEDWKISKDINDERQRRCMEAWKHGSMETTKRQMIGRLEDWQRQTATATATASDG